MGHAKAVGAKVPFALAGGALGVLGGLHESYGSDAKLKAQIAEREADPKPSFSGAASLAQLRARKTMSDFAQKHPGANALGMGLAGAMLGASGGPGTLAALKDVKSEAEKIYDLLRAK